MKNQKSIIIIITIVSLIVIGCSVYFFLRLQPKEQFSVNKETNTQVSTQTKQEQESTVLTKNEKKLTEAEKITAHSFAENILKLLQNRNYGKLHELLTEKDKAKINKEDFIRQWVETLGNQTIIEWEVKEIIEEENGVSVQYVVKYDSLLYSSESGFFQLVKEDGQWSWSLGWSGTIIEKSVGDEIELTTLKYRINKIEEKQILTSQYGKTVAVKENTKFIVIDISIANTTNAGFTFFPNEAFSLIDNKERKFQTYNNTIGSIDNYLDVRELAPSITERGFIVYEIPEDATNYSIFSRKAGTGEIYKVILK